MSIIAKSFLLSFAVFGRMILPVLGILIASSVLWALLNMVSGGYADHVSGPITAAFIALFGIRTALCLQGDIRSAAYDMLALYAVLYGLFFLVAKGAALWMVDLGAVIYAEWQLDGAVSFRSYADAERSLQSAFALHALGAKTIAAFIVYTGIHTAMAVPLANAAQAAGQGAPAAGFFRGFGRGFLPLFCIFALCFFLQFFLGLFTVLFAALPLALSVLSIILTQSLPAYEPDMLLQGLAACAGLLWLHSWIWAASAVALSASAHPIEPPGEDETEPEAVDLRALRKSRSEMGRA